MKKIASSFFCILFLSLLCISASAHPGSLDDNGGHHDSTTGEYHYHHGYPAHGHDNGICPYNFDDKTNDSYNPSSPSDKNNSSSNSVTAPDNLTFEEYIFYSLVSYPVCLILFGIPFTFFFIKYSKNQYINKTLPRNFFIGIIPCSLTFPLISEFSNQTYSWLSFIVAILLLTIIIIWPIRISKYWKYKDKNYTEYFEISTGHRVNIKFDNHKIPIAQQLDKGIYGEYTCYISKSGKTIHFKKGCSNADKVINYIDTKGPYCKKCGKHRNGIEFSRTEYKTFSDFTDIMRLWHLDKNK